MYRAYRHMGDVLGEYGCMDGCTDIWDIHMYGVVQMYGRVYRCIGHRHMGDVLGAYRYIGKYRGCTDMGVYRCSGVHRCMGECTNV